MILTHVDLIEKLLKYVPTKETPDERASFWNRITQRNAESYTVTRTPVASRSETNMRH